jgi:sec-independent protein translocase protein TatB
VLGFSFGEIMVISLVALVAVGPQKLPGMLKTMGQWVRKLRQMTMDVRQQTGIDEMLRAEGIQLSELRSLMRGYHAPIVNNPTPAPAAAPAPAPSPRYEDPYGALEPDPTREYPLEGADAYGALPDDLLEPSPPTEVAAAPGPAPTSVEAPSEASPPEVAAAETSGIEPLATEPPVVPGPAPVIASPVGAPSVVAPAAAEVEPEAGPPASAPSAARRSVPPPPPSRSGVPRPSSGPPPPPRRSSGPPRPEPTGATPSKPEAAPLAVPRPGNANGNG